MEVVRRFWHGRVAPFLEECAFRLALAFDVLVGRVSVERPRRFWNRSLEPPVLINAFDWTDGRLIFSVLVWPSLESDDARAQRERARQVLGVLHAGATEMAWSTRYDVEDGLRWDAERSVWTASDGFAFDGERLFEYSRGGKA